MAIFNSYVKLPEGRFHDNSSNSDHFPRDPGYYVASPSFRLPVELHAPVQPDVVQPASQASQREATKTSTEKPSLQLLNIVMV